MRRVSEGAVERRYHFIELTLQTDLAGAPIIGCSLEHAAKSTSLFVWLALTRTNHPTPTEDSAFTSAYLRCQRHRFTRNLGYIVVICSFPIRSNYICAKRGRRLGFLPAQQPTLAHGGNTSFGIYHYFVRNCVGVTIDYVHQNGVQLAECMGLLDELVEH